MTVLADLNKKILNNFMSSKLFIESTNIMCFVSFGSEVDTHSIIQNSLENSKKIFVPYIEEGKKEMKISQIESFDDLVPGRFNILEPKADKIREASKDDLDLIIVPGLVFDKKGYRIGYGGGYYDKFMASMKKNTKKLGISFNFQLINDKLPKDEFDIPVNYILTEKGIITAKS